MENIFAQLLTERRKEEVQRILKCNEMTQRYGLTLTGQEAGELMACRTDSLKESGRVELGESVLPAVIEAFCDSAYICQDNYVEVINRLQELFYLYKNESADQLTDGELLDFMRKQFDDICFGDLTIWAEPAWNGLPGRCAPAGSAVCNAGRGTNTACGKPTVTMGSWTRRQDGSMRFTG